MEEDRIRTPVLTPTGIDIIRDIHSESGVLGPQALDALLARHDSLQDCLTRLLETHRQGEPISQGMWDLVARLLFKEASYEGADQDAEQESGQ